MFNQLVCHLSTNLSACNTHAYEHRGSIPVHAEIVWLIIMTTKTASPQSLGLIPNGRLKKFMDVHIWSALTELFHYGDNAF